ncbi:unnamed protein product [Cercopithifilaria johnstoni]|uniref:Uncharacterized protein n=1 Tax=Cercopithifilaria johnstoni TaxID=2874296 RepID=A0A8J2MLU7_9BILA|nr:unnamed protein product [Cercopithifilaria johnstoni]
MLELFVKRDMNFDMVKVNARKMMESSLSNAYVHIVLIPNNNVIGRELIKKNGVDVDSQVSSARVKQKDCCLEARVRAHKARWRDGDDDNDDDSDVDEEKKGERKER